MKYQSALLHPDNLRRIPFTGRRIVANLEARALEIQQLTKGQTDPDVSIIIRTKNSQAFLPSLLGDIKQQEYDGKIELIFIDTESTDKTLEYARAAGAKIIPVTQAGFSYPKTLNQGFEAATSPYVVSVVGHSNFTNRYCLKALTYWAQEANLGGIYGITMPANNASWIERYLSTFALGSRKPRRIAKATMGVLGGNGSIIKASVWRQLGRFDESYGAGGEDMDMARKMLADDLLIVREPLCMVHHSHGVSFMGEVRQALYWYKLRKPHQFDVAKLQSYRDDL